MVEAREKGGGEYEAGGGDLEVALDQTLIRFRAERLGYFPHMKLNKTWHLKHPMPLKATFEQRVNWHLEHVNYCQCRGIPEKLAQQMREKGIKAP